MWLLHNLIEHIPISKYVLNINEHILVFLRIKVKKKKVQLCLLWKKC